MTASSFGLFSVHLAAALFQHSESHCSCWELPHQYLTVFYVMNVGTLVPRVNKI